MISSLIEILPVSLVQGLILSLVALGLSIPFRYLNSADLSSEGTYPLGGALFAGLLISGYSLPTAMIIAVIGGGLAGMMTAYLHLKLNIHSLLSGIIVSTMLYSVNLRLMGTPNIPLFNSATVFDYFPGTLLQIIILLSLNLSLIGLLFLFSRTQQGLQVRAIGMNPTFSQSVGISTQKWLLFGFFAGNALCALAGLLMVQLHHYADIGMGVGIVLHGLAALLLGESLIGTGTVLRSLMAPLCGALVYQPLSGLLLNSGLAPSDLKFVTGLILIATIAYQHKRV